jgi:endonuclease/exonuclease/phosphatase family protein
MVVVGTWNLENLFRPGGNGAPSNDAAYQAKLDTLAAVINRLAPDVLAVQEVGDPEALADLAGKLNGSWHTELSTLPTWTAARPAGKARTCSTSESGCCER